MSYYQLLRREPRPLLFATTNAFFSSMGQSHFLSIFSLYIMTQLQITNTQYGSLYSAATLASAALLPFVGPIIDRIDIRRYCLFVAIGLISGILFLALGHHITIGFLGLLLLRLNGQALCGHINSVSTARYFHADRGKALSLTNTGFPLAEGLFTPFMAMVIASFGATTALLIMMLLVSFVYVPITQLVTKGIPKFNKPNLVTPSSGAHTSSRNWDTKDVLSDKVFYLLIPHSVFPAFSLTGFLLYQAVFSELKLWPTNTIAIALSTFALGRITSSFLAGPLVDRLGSIRLFPYYQIPLTIGFLSFTFLNGVWSAYLSMVFFGITVGISGPIKSSIWAELYGLKYLGSIKSLFATIVVMMTAISSFLFGLAIDAGITGQLAPIMAAISVFTALLAYIATRGCHTGDPQQ